MKTFSISEAAKAEIGLDIESSGCRDPVITLSDSSTLNLPDRLKSAVKRGLSGAEFEEVQSLAEKRVLENTESSSISISVFEREECRPEDLSEIDGITLAMTVQMREALSDYCLMYTGGRFILESPDETAFNLRSVKTLAKWFA